MPYATTDDGVRLYYEEAGSGVPVIFVHEFAGDLRSWEPQLRHFSRQYRCIAFNARGFPPSDVPEHASSYSQLRAATDITCVLDALQIDKAHIVGLSMGGFATLQLGMSFPDRALSLCVGGAGYGSELEKRAQFQGEADTIVAFIESEGIEAFAEKYSGGPTRVQFEDKDPRGFLEFKKTLAEHSALGAANTQRGVQRERPSLYSLTEEMQGIDIPTLVITGDEDWPCLEPALLMKRTIPSAALSVLPNAGHTINIEVIAEYNQAVGSFISLVDSGRWPKRNPRAVTASITGMK